MPKYEYILWKQHLFLNLRMGQPHLYKNLIQLSTTKCNKCRNKKLPSTVQSLERKKWRNETYVKEKGRAGSGGDGESAKVSWDAWGKYLIEWRYAYLLALLCSVSRKPDIGPKHLVPKILGCDVGSSLLHPLEVVGGSVLAAAHQCYY